MTFRLGMKALAQFSSQMGTMVEAGLPIRKSLATVERGAVGSRRRMYRRIAAAIENGATLSEAMEQQGRAFPALSLRLVKVGETAGVLEKVFKGLADYYDLLRSIWTKMIVGLIYPAFEYLGLVGVLTVVTYIFAMLGQGQGTGEGASPGMAALRVFTTGMLIFVAPIVLYFVVTRLFGGLRVVHELLLHVPVIGNVMRTIAIARFSWCMELMTDAGMQIYNSITWSLEATANGAFAARATGVIQRLKDGQPLHESLQKTGLFPHDYVEMISVAEVSGSMPEMFGRLARNYFEKMGQALKAFGTVVFWLVWIVVAGVIIYYIFRFASMAFGHLNTITNI